MKRLLLCISCILLAISLPLSAAFANSWGLTGDLYHAVSSVTTWNNYSTLCKQAGNLAVMYSRYHNVLMAVDDQKQLSVYPEAVYQPDVKLNRDVKLTETPDGFILTYGDTEQYTFVLIHNVYQLQTAVIDSFHLDAQITGSGNTRVIDFYTATDGTESAVLCPSIALKDFNIALFPHSVADIRHTNLMRAILYISDGYMKQDDPEVLALNHHSNIGTGSEPVYSSPFGASAWRAAKGKAVVSLKDEFWTLWGTVNGDQKAYACIRYNVSERTQRIGYIRATVLDPAADQTWAPNPRFLAINVQASQDTYLTDDPDVSQYPQFAVPKGTLFTCLGLYSRDYAYVSAEVRDGKFVDGGAIVYGFVPLRALSLPESYTVDYPQQPDIMATLAGTWKYTEGGCMADELLILNADGTCSCGNEEQAGTWTVTRYHPFWNLYWAAVDYQFTLLREDGTAVVKGLMLTDNSFSLIDSEGSGGYSRVNTP